MIFKSFMRQPLFKYQDKSETLMRFARYIKSRLNENKGVKQYINDENLKEVEWLLIAVEAVMSNKEEIFITRTINKAIQ